MRSRRSIRARIAAGAAATLVVALGGPTVSGFSATPPIANEGGPAVVNGNPADANTLNKPQNSGDQLTKWVLKLPDGAKCSKSTAAAGYHVFTYVVLSTVDPGTLAFTADGPDQGNPLYDDGGSPLIGINTAVSPAGAVVPIPFTTMDWNVFDTTLLPPGSYNVGIACADGAGVGDKYWNVVETFTATTADPTRFTWAVAGAGGADTTTTTVGGGTTTTTADPSGTTTTSSTTSTTVDPSSTTTSSTSTTSTTTDPSATTSTTAGTSTDTGSGSSSSSGGGLAFTGATGLRIGGLGLLLFVVGWAVDRRFDRNRRLDESPE